jgi:solute carrier family 25 carnitine/acylcarnitine transporter 20/29
MADKANNGKTPTGNGGVFFFPMNKKAKTFFKKYRTEIAASSSSVLSTFAAFPLDFAKSRMQSYNTTFTATVKDAYRAEGLRAFWRGVIPPIISVTMVRTISFSIYQRAKYASDDAIKRMAGKSPLALANAPNSYPSLYTLGCFGSAGALSGAVITLISCPFELTKLNEQLAGKVLRDCEAAKEAAIKANKPPPPPPVGDLYKTGSLHTARRLISERGISGLYSGYRLHLTRDTIGTAIYFMTYESAKQLLANARGREPTSPYAVVIAGGLCGIVSWACIYPIDVAKTLYQKQLLQAGKNVTVRPPIKFFKFGSYRGKSSHHHHLPTHPNTDSAPK